MPDVAVPVAVLGRSAGTVHIRHPPGGVAAKGVVLVLGWAFSAARHVRKYADMVASLPAAAGHTVMFTTTPQLLLVDASGALSKRYLDELVRVVTQRWGGAPGARVPVVVYGFSNNGALAALQLVHRTGFAEECELRGVVLDSSPGRLDPYLALRVLYTPLVNRPWAAAAGRALRALPGGASLLPKVLNGGALAATALLALLLQWAAPGAWGAAPRAAKASGLLLALLALGVTRMYHPLLRLSLLLDADDLECAGLAPVEVVAPRRDASFAAFRPDPEFIGGDEAAAAGRGDLTPPLSWFQLRPPAPVRSPLTTQFWQALAVMDLTAAGRGERARAGAVGAGAVPYLFLYSKKDVLCEPWAVERVVRYRRAVLAALSDAASPSDAALTAAARDALPHLAHGMPQTAVPPEVARLAQAHYFDATQHCAHLPTYRSEYAAALEGFLAPVL